MRPASERDRDVGCDDQRAPLDRHQPRFSVPLPRAGVSVDAAIAERLSQALGRVVAVCAPGGYGKTSQLAAWASGDERAVAWADLERVDNDPTVLLEVLVQLLGEVTDFDAGALPCPRPAPAELRDVVIPAFGRLVAGCRWPFVIVLDDVHTIESGPAIDLLDALARNVPVGSTVVLSGRALPPASLGRLRVEPGLVEIGARELAMDAVDADALFRSMGLALEARDVASLVRRTEGWPVGLRLAGLALLGEPDLAAAVAAFTGEDRYVADYLREEWMRGLSRAEADFLLQVSCLGWFSGVLCDDVLERVGSARMLEHLHANGLLVIPLDRRHEWFRMHHLLADFLRDELSRVDPGQVRTLHERASSWFEAHGDLDRAFGHAMHAGDLARAERLVVTHGGTYDTHGRHATVLDWLASFPQHYVTVRPALCVVAAVTALGVGDGEACAGWMRFLEQAVDSTDADDAADQATYLKAKLLRATTDRAPVADLVDDAELAYRELGPGDWHAMACLVLGALNLLQDEAGRATELFAQGVVEARISGAPTLQAYCLAELALVHDDAGDYDQATRRARAARAALNGHDPQRIHTTALVTAMDALASARAGDVEAARADVLLARRQLVGLEPVMPWLNIQTRLALTRTSLVLGDLGAARTLLDEAESHLTAQPDAIWAKARMAELSDVGAARRQVVPRGAPGLTTAELKVLHYLPTNLRIADIAARLYVSRNTAKSHVAAIYCKFGTSSRVETVEVARRTGLLPCIKPDPGEPSFAAQSSAGVTAV